MSKVFLIVGIGADTRLYNNIDLNDHDVIPVDWIEPNKHDTLHTYAQKLIHQYNITPNSIVIGDSLGGMIAIEIAKLIPLNKTIIISSIKTIDEAPWYFSFFNTIPIYKLIPVKLLTQLGFLIKLLTQLGFLIKPIFGKMSTDDLWLFNDMYKKSSPVFFEMGYESCFALGK